MCARVRVVYESAYRARLPDPYACIAEVKGRCLGLWSSSGRCACLDS